MISFFDSLRYFHTRKFSKDPERLLARSTVFCMAPRTHIHILPSGKIYTCCLSAVTENSAVGDLWKGDTLEGAWNSPSMREVRVNMLEGRESAQCDRCYIQERNNQVSYRQTFNITMAHHFNVVLRTARDGTSDCFNVPYLDLRFSNRCNYRCRICCPDLSSGWYQDALKLGSITDSAPREINAVDGNGALLPGIFDLLDDVERVQFGGGEPLVMDEHYRVLEKLLEKGKRNVHLMYNTNCSVLQYKNYDVLEMWKSFEDVFIMASLDGSHRRGDYIRKGQKWDVTEKNLSLIKEACPHVRLHLFPTISIFNAIHLIDFYKEMLEKGLIGADDIIANMLVEPVEYNIRNFPPHLKSEITRKYDDFIATCLEGEDVVEETKNQFRAVITYMNGEDLDHLGKFRSATKRLDEMRNEDFREVFPEIKELLE